MGVEILIGLALAFVVLGPERMHTMLGHLGKAKAQLEKATQETRQQLTGQLSDASRVRDEKRRADLLMFSEEESNITS
jgi:Sec-independent protein translocase protein TatA